MLLTAAGVSILVLAFNLAAGEAHVRHRERSRSTVPRTMPLLYYRPVRLRHALVGTTHILDRSPGTRLDSVGRMMVIEDSMDARWEQELHVAAKPSELVAIGIPTLVIADAESATGSEVRRGAVPPQPGHSSGIL